MYYEVDFCRCKTSTEKTMLRKLAKGGDCIEWYNDGKNIFFGAATLNEENVVITILNTIGNVNINYCMWGI